MFSNIKFGDIGSTYDSSGEVDEEDDDEVDDDEDCDCDFDCDH